MDIPLIPLRIFFESSSNLLRDNDLNFGGPLDKRTIDVDEEDIQTESSEGHLGESNKRARTSHEPVSLQNVHDDVKNDIQPENDQRPS